VTVRPEHKAATSCRLEDGTLTGHPTNEKLLTIDKFKSLTDGQSPVRLKRTQEEQDATDRRAPDRKCRQNSCIANEILVTQAAAWTVLKLSHRHPGAS